MSSELSIWHGTCCVRNIETLSVLSNTKKNSNIDAEYIAFQERRRQAMLSMSTVTLGCDAAEAQSVHDKLIALPCSTTQDRWRRTGDPGQVTQGRCPRIGDPGQGTQNRGCRTEEEGQVTQDWRTRTGDPVSATPSSLKSTPMYFCLQQHRSMQCRATPRQHACLHCPCSWNGCMLYRKRYEDKSSDHIARPQSGLHSGPSLRSNFCQPGKTRVCGCLLVVHCCWQGTMQLSIGINIVFPTHHMQAVH